jgi:hypothetical protein
MRIFAPIRILSVILRKIWIASLDASLSQAVRLLHRNSGYTARCGSGTDSGCTARQENNILGDITINLAVSPFFDFVFVILDYLIYNDYKYDSRRLCMNQPKRKNICGLKIRKLRQSLRYKTSQQQIAEKLCLMGFDVDKNVIQRVESGCRYVTDVEIKYFAELFHVSYSDLLDE